MMIKKYKFLKIKMMIKKYKYHKIKNKIKKRNNKIKNLKKLNGWILILKIQIILNQKKKKYKKKMKLIMIKEQYLSRVYH